MFPKTEAQLRPLYLENDIDDGLEGDYPTCPHGNSLSGLCEEKCSTCGHQCEMHWTEYDDGIEVGHCHVCKCETFVVIEDE